MSTESLDRNFITQQLADMAADIKRTALETKGQKLSSAMALGQALLKVGRTHLTESLRLMSEASVAASIDYYINNMPPLQAEQFKIGLSFGILGSTIAAIEDPKQYLTYFNNYITGTPLPSEPTKLYKQAEVISQSRGMIEPEKESQRLRELVTKDPSLSSILSNIESLPTTV
ncbi:MAG: hypothetical protein HYZ79_01420, partial [Candidatus Melainabacteria bacterium]|nr:hypothetical protein [Candidatus Melainabacteria bacterium]